MSNRLARLAGAERQRVRRQRQRAGIGIANVEYDHDALDWLIERRWLSAWDEQDRGKVSEAIGAAFRELVTRDAGDSASALDYDTSDSEDECST